MELREFAERVLFATTIEEKLLSPDPDTITDSSPGSPIVAPAMPGRPASLQFKQRESGRSEFPGTRQLEQPAVRGRLLHFFANHELLATELMALALLRFPDAPPAFRRAVFQTLLDEQEHAHLYLDAMRPCGIGFGELPVSGFFWRAVAPMQSPMDYVAGLSLTFEQANLDFARHFSRHFGEVGDDANARLLDRIYRDEIGHVATGLKWFRRWKDARLSDWEAFCRQLQLPLSPRRARGIDLNVEGRRAAGLDPDFIAELAVYSQSKGRTPTVYLFNPFAEGHIAMGPAFTPTRPQALLARDLAPIPMFLCRQDDIVVVPKRPAVGFLAALGAAGFVLPEFVECDDLRANGGASLAQALGGRKLAGLRPWAWSPDSVAAFEPILDQVTGTARRTAAACFNDGIATLYSKAWSAGFLRLLLASHDAGQAAGSDSSWLSPPDVAGTAVTTLAAALDAITDIRGRGYQRVVVKQALGLAGSNAIRLWEPGILDPQRRWIEGCLAQRQTLVIEPWLDRVFDFSVQLEMTSCGLELRGWTTLYTDARGQFRGNSAAPDHACRPPAAIAAHVQTPRDVSRRVRELYARVVQSLEMKLREAGFLGPVGLDAFVYRSSDGRCRLKPIVEINPRYTMGRLTVELMRRTAPGSHGCFRILRVSDARAAGVDSLAALGRAVIEKNPVRFEGKPVPGIREGIVCLNDPAEARACLAVFVVTRSPHPERQDTPNRCA